MNIKERELKLNDVWNDITCNGVCDFTYTPITELRIDVGFVGYLCESALEHNIYRPLISTDIWNYDLVEVVLNNAKILGIETYLDMFKFLTHIQLISYNELYELYESDVEDYNQSTDYELQDQQDIIEWLNGAFNISDMEFEFLTLNDDSFLVWNEDWKQELTTVKY